MLNYVYDKIGRIKEAGKERFAFDPASNILDKKAQDAVSDSLYRPKGNRISEFEDTKYIYDELGNLTLRELPDGEIQLYSYDTENQLSTATIHKTNGEVQKWEYAYDPFGRRLSKERKDKLAWISTEPKRTHFVWDGSRLLQEYNYKGSYTYFYTDQDSYEPLAQVFYNNKDEKQYLAYFHNDQIGIPREMTDPFGNLLWYGEYTAWGKLASQTKVYPLVHQPFRLQNQYYDSETGLHYNFFRYYESETGRFINQDPIGLVGGENFYNFAPNVQEWIDPLGLAKTPRVKLGSLGEVRSASVVLKRSHLGKGQATNQDNRNYARSLGHCTDDAGHILAKILGGSRRNQNMFPQLPRINRGQYRTFERRVRQAIAQDGKALLKWKFIYSNGGTRPTGVVYELFQGGQRVLRQKFSN